MAPMHPIKRVPRSWSFCAMLAGVICAVPGGTSLHAVRVLEGRADSVLADTSQDTTLTPEHGALLAQLAQVSQQARRRHLTPVLDIGAPWCGPCHALDHILASSDMRQVMRQMYVVHLDVDQWGSALQHLWVDVSTIPHVVALDTTGTPVRPAWSLGDDVPDSLVVGSPAWEVAVGKSLRRYFEHARTRFALGSAAQAGKRRSEPAPAA